jgi:general secretion pathway protein N
MNKIDLTGFVVMLALLSSAADAQSPPANAPVRSFAMPPPLEELRATRERPLFSPARRPDAEAAADPVAVVEESPDSLPFDLTGVVMGADRAIAILRNRDTQETVHLRQGEVLDTWSIEEIAPRHIVLRQDDRHVRLELFPPKPEGPAIVPSSLSPPVTRSNPNRLEPQLRRSTQPTASQRRAVRRGAPPQRRQNP